MKCLCIGICHMRAVYNILKEDPVFSSIYDDIICHLVFMLSEKEMEHILDNIVPECDLILSQPVSSNYKGSDLFSTKMLRSRIKEGGKHLILPNCYFTGYDPVPFQTTNDKHEIISSAMGISYYPSLCLKSLLEGNVEQACKDWCNINAYTDEEIKNNFEKSITELKQREQKVFDNEYGVDVIISDYIENNYRSDFLFHTYNHPTNLLLVELARRTMHKLGIPNINLGSKLTKELLGDVSIPPPLCLYYRQEFIFEYPSFHLFGNKYTTIEVMKIFSDNLKEHSPKLHEQWLSCISYGRVKINNTN